MVVLIQCTGSFNQYRTTVEVHKIAPLTYATTQLDTK